jgi:hypothetical protein
MHSDKACSEIASVFRDGKHVVAGRLKSRGGGGRVQNGPPVQKFRSANFGGGEQKQIRHPFHSDY